MYMIFFARTLTGINGLINFTSVIEYYGPDKGIYMTKFFDLNLVISNFLFCLLNYFLVKNLEF